METEHKDDYEIFDLKTIFNQSVFYFTVIVLSYS